MKETITRRMLVKSAGLCAGALTLGRTGHTAPADDSTGLQSDELVSVGKLLEGNRPVKWVFAGDSITHGARHLNGWRDYPQLFEERLRYEMGKERNLVIRTATSGWTIERLSEDLEWRVLQFTPNIVSFHFGMNDCTAGMDGLPRFRELYPEIIRRVRGECGAAILIHTPNPVLPEAETRRAPYIEAYAGAIREIAEQTGALLVDHYAAWAAYGEKSQLYYLMNDALHPNEFGHRFKAQLLFRVLGMYDPESAVCRLIIPR